LHKGIWQTYLLLAAVFTRENHFITWRTGGRQPPRKKNHA
jgi:hypothetical protein